MKHTLQALLLFVSPWVFGQTYFPTNEGVKTTSSIYQAFTNATIHTVAGQKIEGATLIEKNGVITAVGTNVTIPKNATVHDMKGKHLYPSFVELQSSFGIAKPKANRSGGRSAQYEPSRSGYYWNDHILSDYNSLQDYQYDKKQASELRNSGFGVVNAHNADGIHRGTSIVVSLQDDAPESSRLLDAKAAEHFSFRKSIRSSQSYPSSVMGAMALLRQLYHDAAWYKAGNATSKDLALEAVIEQNGLPKFFEANNKLDVLRAAKIGREMKLNLAITASGQEYEILNDLKATGAKLIVPLNFPKAYETNDPLLLNKISLRELRLWNQAPSNPGQIAAANIPFALTSAGTKSSKEFLNNLKLAVKYGLNENKALEALTATPAKMLGMANKIGALKTGYYANFIVTDAPLFEEKSKMTAHWVQGKEHVIVDENLVDIDGDYTFNIQESVYSMSIKNSTSKAQVTVKKDSTKVKSIAGYENNNLRLLIENKDTKTYLRLYTDATKKGLVNGQGKDSEGNTIDWVLTTSESDAPEEKQKDLGSAEKRTILPIAYPNTGFGHTSLPKAKSVLYKNATVWTNEDAGILSNTDVLVSEGKIAAIGQNLAAGDAQIIDATGKHLTSGIIDEHSHIAASSINEGGHNSSAEVSIEDVIDPDDINIYRNLAGGVTTIQILHGSANPIGGRSAIIKLKWGEGIENLKFSGADPFIKFALGENVKQSNWSSFNRFPQTRMGVEQVFVDYFQRAKEYGETWKKYNALTPRQKARQKQPRYDIEMQTLWEILEGKRFISCHSYVQSEINMLMKVADQFGFRVNTFTHILEGYKVADKMQEHGVGGSTFSDWWAYKYEVQDAIPYNGAIMHNAGVTVAFNSDDAEMSRRLNQEAAKAVKYGGVSEEDAWKFVTLNPAKLLHIDDQVGSVKVGKNADLVLWSEHPMSIYAVAEKTMIDGAFYYEADQVASQLEAIENEKETIIQQMIQFGKETGGTQTPQTSSKRLFFCETLD